jgi:glycosyltransferase involved in cell wall biosynthesis
MNALISVIVPCYNQAQFLDECLQSVWDQTYPHWECIVVNDGSPDNTEEVVMPWLKKDSRFKYIRKENGGPGSTRNAGIKIAQGEYIQLLDADDTIHKLKFEKQLECMQNQSDIVICDYFPYDYQYGTFASHCYRTPFMNSDQLHYDIITYWEDKISIPIHTILFKRSLIVSPQLLFDESLPNHMDWVFWVQLFQRTKKIQNLRIALANYRIQPNSICRDVDAMSKGFILAGEKLVEGFTATNDPVGEKYARNKLYWIKKRDENRRMNGKRTVAQSPLVSFIHKVYRKVKSFF